MHLTEIHSLTPEQPMVAKENSLLTGRHLEWEQVHIGVTLLLITSWVKKEEGQKRGGRTETASITFCILYFLEVTLMLVHTHQLRERIINL